MDQLISIFLGFVASKLQGKTELSKRVKYILSLLACVVAGFVAHGVQIGFGGEFNLNELLANIGIAFTTSQTYYNTYFKLNS